MHAVVRVLCFAVCCLIATAAGPHLFAQRAVILEDLEYLSLHEAAARFNLQAAWVTPGKELALSGRTARLDFKAASREVRVNGMRVFLGEPVLLQRNHLHISRIDFETALRPILMPQAQVPPGSVRTIVIDPGHGGRDPGTRNSQLGLQEKELSLQVARRLARILQQQGYQVRLTRTDDAFVSLEERSARSVAAGADLFISIHFNAVDNPAVHGVETYILTPRTHRSTGQQNAASSDANLHPGNAYDHWNALLGFLVQRQLLRDLGSFDRGLKRARFQVLRGVQCPAVLVEAGYLSNSTEAARVATPEFQEKLAHSLALAIDRYRQATENLASAGR